MSSSEGTIDIRIVLRERISLVLQQAGVAPIAELVLEHRGSGLLTDVVATVSFDPPIADPWVLKSERMGAGETLRASEPRVGWRAAELARLEGRQTGTVRVEVEATPVRPGDDGVPVALERLQVSHRAEVELLSPADWPGSAAPMELLAAWVMPNDPGVAHLLRATADILQEWTRDPALDGYQRRDRARVRLVAAAIYAAMQRLDVTYVVAPAHVATNGQPLRSPSRVLQERMGNCIDVALLAASAMEQAGLHPLLFVVQGHAFVGAWLDEDGLPLPVDSEPRRFTSLLDRGALVAFDATHATARPVVPFERAEAAARAELDKTETFHAAIDVRVARRDRVLPLSTPAEHAERMARGALSERASEHASRPDAERRLAVRERAEELARTAGAAAAESKVDAASLRRLDVWRSRLLDLTLNNRMLNHRSTGGWLPLDAGAVETDAALSGSRGLVVQVREGTRPTGEEADATFRRERGDAALRSSIALTDLTPAELGKRGTQLFRAARIAREEGGASGLYLSLGFLAWFESESSQRELHAPVLLRPVALEREPGGATWRIVRVEEEPFLNPALVEKLKADFGLDLAQLGELPRNDAGVDVEVTLHRVREIVAAQARWVVRETCGVGLFTFAKFLMYNDLSARVDDVLANPVARMVLTGQAEPGVRGRGHLVAESEVESALVPRATFCPLDADASQLAAVASAVAGASFVIQGPPGTGKSQTITNMIAQLLAEGKRVLFVSEKLAALEVVHRRLVQVGLGPFCFEVHGKNTSRRAMIEQLAEPLALAESMPAVAWADHAGRLAQRRDELNRYADAIGRRRTMGTSVFDAMGRLMALRAVPRVALTWSHRAETIDETTWRETLERASAWAAAARETGPVHVHPLAVVDSMHWSPTLPASLPGMLDRIDAAAQELELAWRRVEERMGEPLTCNAQTLAWMKEAAVLARGGLVPRELLAADPWPVVEPQVRALVATQRARAQAWAALEPNWLPAVVDREVAPWQEVLRRPLWWLLLLVTILPWLRTRGEVRAVSTPAGAGRGASAQADDLDAVAGVRGLDATVAAEGGRLASSLGWLWPAAVQDPSRIEAAIEVVERARALRQAAYAIGGTVGDALVRRVERIVCDAEWREVVVPAFDALDAALAGLNAVRAHASSSFTWADAGPDVAVTVHVRSVVRGLRDATPAVLRAWAHLLQTRQGMHEVQLQPVVAAFASGSLAPNALDDVVEASILQWWIEGILADEPVLRGFHRAEHERRIASFRELDRASLSLASEEVRARLAARIPAADAPRAQGSELNLLLRELQKQRGHLPLRRLMSMIPSLIQALKPCFLMSPLSIAQHLDAGLDGFDVVIFDEASQIPSSDAIGALARAKQAIVVGDTRQLPPTSFFQRTEDDAVVDEAGYQELESILNECLAAGMPEIYLRWHYRSNDESLIAFSNANYYDHRLVTFPSPSAREEDQGVRLVWVGGTYARGGGRTNQKEAEAVVAEVVRRLRDPQLQRDSLGVITFSVAQQGMIEDLIDKARQQHPEIERFFGGDTLEPVFVKNLENVQGDERDTILFSTCYGPDESGRLAMNFGPLNREGGERRLNVAVTRARTRLFVFTSLDPEMIDLRKTKAVGVAHLRQFLQFAASGPGVLGAAVIEAGRFDSPFEKQVCDALRRQGWDVDTQVGCSGFRIDLGVRHPDRPGRHVLGIECDGATYHSSRSARDRDRLRQQILEEKMGWRIHRIWSTDWWIDPEGETARAVEAIRDAIRDGVLAREEEASVATVAPEPTADDAADNAAGDATEPEDLRRAVVQRFADAPSIADSPERLPDARVYAAVEVPWVGGGVDTFRSTNPGWLQDACVRIVREEAPIASRRLVRRLLTAFDVRRVSSGLEDEVLGLARRAGLFVDSDGFVWLSPDARRDWRGFRVGPMEEATRASIEEVAGLELRAAMRSVVGVSGALDVDELLREVARVFGGTPRAAAVRARLDAALEASLAEGELVRDEGGRVRRAG